MDNYDNLTHIAETYANLMQSYLTNTCPVTLETARKLGNLGTTIHIDFSELNYDSRI